MNLSLQDPFSVAKEFPETLTQTLQYGHSVVIQFNEKGDYLASGLSDGSIIIYDLTSNGGIIAILQRGGHIRPITSLSWSSCGRYILSSSQDWTSLLWDLSKINQDRDEDDYDNPIIRKVEFEGPIWLSMLNPTNPFIFTASLFEDNPVYVDMIDKANIKITKLDTIPLPIRKEEEEQELYDNDNNNYNDDDDEQPKKKKKKNDKHVTLVSIFTPNDGNYIFTGTSKGWINIFTTMKGEINMVHSFKIGNSNIKTLVISPNGRKLGVNASDRIIRQINVPDLINIENPEQWEFEIEHKYQDVVNRLQWNTVSFNHNGEFLVASTFGQSSQDLYMWETALGSLIKILEGSPEELIDVKWNSYRCMIGSTGLDSGTVYLWSIQFPQKWSALAPDFVEIEENIEYEEKEDEFDIIDEDVLIKKRMEEEDLMVDIVTKEPLDARGFDVTTSSFVIPIYYERNIEQDLYT